jgi:glycosyltransferase involved in cell wall biosynthesis
MRVAWIGPNPGDEGGAANVGTLVLEGLGRLGAQVDCFVTVAEEDLPPSLRGTPGLRFVSQELGWRWGRWYSRTPVVSFLTGLAARAYAHASLAGQVVSRHREQPYDVLYQFSQIELFRFRRLRAELPPIVTHPEVHAAGELAWHRRESDLVRPREPLWRHLTVRAMLSTRARVQARDLRLASRVIAPSRRFAAHLARDYGLPSDLFEVVPNPIDLDRFQPPDVGGARSGVPLTVLFVSRLAVRKGVELVTRLSHRLADLEGMLRIRVIGGPSLWSDYRGLLRDLNPALADYAGEKSPAELAREYQAAGLLIQPSHYEPFALTVAEALACGLPVVASDEVGAAEDVSSRCCTRFPAGDLDGLERAVRDLVERIRREGRDEIARQARAEAARLFAPDRIASAVASCLESAAARTPAEGALR